MIIIKFILGLYQIDSVKTMAIKMRILKFYVKKNTTCDMNIRLRK